MLYARGAQKVRDSNEKIEVEEGEPMQEDLACVSLDFTQLGSTLCAGTS